MQEARKNAPPMPGFSKNSMIGMMVTLVIMVVVMQFRAQIGGALNFVFEPVIGFNGQWPVLTLIIAGIIMITISTIIRSYLTDFVTQARNQKISKDLNKEMRQAKLENNLFKLKKLQEEQPKVAAQSMEASTQMMKLMPVTMVVVIPIYAWIWYFVSNVVSPDALLVNLPFATVHLQDYIWMFPMWIILYTMVSLPIGQLESRIVKYFMFRRRLKELESPGFKS